MLNMHLMSPEKAQLHVEVMAFLIKNFGPPKRPLMPVSRHPSKGLETLAWKSRDTRSVFEWAQDQFGVITARNHMEDFAVCLVANDSDMDVSQIAAQRRIDSLAVGQNPYYGPVGTPVLYDPRDCSEPGYFTATITLQFGELRALGFQSKTPLSPLMQRMVTLISAVYNCQGFVLSHLLRPLSAYLTPDDYRRAVPEKDVNDALCFSTCLALRTLGFSEAQIMSTYRGSMTRHFSRKIRQACRQINANDDALLSLQRLSSGETTKRFA